MTPIERTWDVVVVGAGPAGSLAARELARRGACVLLVDQAVFPRSKVCGCCVNAAALAALRAAGLGHLPGGLGAVTIHRLELWAGGHVAMVPLQRGVSVSRAALDMALVEEAVRSGAVFRDGTHGALADTTPTARRVTLRGRWGAEVVAARLVLAADGLDGRLLAGEAGVRILVSGGSRIGLAASTHAVPAGWDHGTVHMACGRDGYVGLVRLEDMRLHVAAAVDPRFVRRAGGAGAAIAWVLAESGIDPPPIPAAMPWRGTALLTRRPSALGGDRVLALGDAAGYVEPFTGEGVAWALASALAIRPLAEAAVAAWRPHLVRCWMQRHRQQIGRRRRVCRIARYVLRRPALVGAAVRALALAPELALPVVRRIGAPLSPAPVPPGARS